MIAPTVSCSVWHKWVSLVAMAAVSTAVAVFICLLILWMDTTDLRKEAPARRQGTSSAH